MLSAVDLGLCLGRIHMFAMANSQSFVSVRNRCSQEPQTTGRKTALIKTKQSQAGTSEHVHSSHRSVKLVSNSPLKYKVN